MADKKPAAKKPAAKKDEVAHPATKSSVDKLRGRVDAIETYLRGNHGYDPDGA